MATAIARTSGIAHYKGMRNAVRTLVLFSGLALALFMFSVGSSPKSAEWWVVSTVVFAFDLSPLIAAYLTVVKTGRPELRAMMAIMAAGYIGFAALAFHSTFREPDPTNGLAFIWVPAFGWMELPAAVVAAALVIWVRERRARRESIKFPPFHTGSD